MIGVNGIILSILEYALMLVNAPKDATRLTGDQTTLDHKSPLLKMQVYLGKSTKGMKNSGFSICMPE